MATTAIAMRTKDQSDTTGTTTINYVNPNATSEQLQSLASAINALTTNQIVDLTRIDKQVLGSEIAKLPRNLTITPATLNYSNLVTTVDGAFNQETTKPVIAFDGTDVTNSDVSITVEGEDNILMSYYIDSDNYEYSELYLARGSSATPKGVNTITVNIPETDTYQAATATLTINNA